MAYIRLYIQATWHDFSLQMQLCPNYDPIKPGLAIGRRQKSYTQDVNELKLQLSPSQTELKAI